MIPVARLRVGPGGLRALPTAGEFWWSDPWLLVHHGADGWLAVHPDGAWRLRLPAAHVTVTPGGLALHHRHGRITLDHGLRYERWSPTEPEGLAEAKARVATGDATWWLDEGYAWRQRAGSAPRAIARADRLFAGPSGAAVHRRGERWSVTPPDGPTVPVPDEPEIVRFSADGWRVRLDASVLDLRTGGRRTQDDSDATWGDADDARIVGGGVIGAPCPVPGFAHGRPARAETTLFGPAAGFWDLQGGISWIGRPDVPLPPTAAAPVGDAWVVLTGDRLAMLWPQRSLSTSDLGIAGVLRLAPVPEGLIYETEAGRFVIRAPSAPPSAWSGRWPRPTPVTVPGATLEPDGLFIEDAADGRPIEQPVANRAGA